MIKIMNKMVWLVLCVAMFSCGVDGDPGHCYFSLDWEYYNEDYGVYYYEDNNPDVPLSSEIDPGIYYDCYPGEYDFYYESEDPEFIYRYNGYYNLYQNQGLPGGLLRDGPDGADTYLDLYLLVYAEEEDLLIVQHTPGEPLMTYTEKPGLLTGEMNEGKFDPYKDLQPVKSTEFSYSISKNGWTIDFEGTCQVFRKEF